MVILLVAWMLSAVGRAATDRPSGTGRTAFSHSIAPLATTAVDANGQPNPAVITRTALTDAETAATTRIEIALGMRNFDELESRLAHSEIIAPEEMAARYLPLEADHERIVRWLGSEGVKITRTDANRLAVFAETSVAEAARVFGTSFVRVTADGKEYTSANSPPSLPSELAPAVRGIHGLQPHLRLRRRPHSSLQPLAGTGSSIPYYPAQIAKAYNADTLGLTGTGQTIAIYALAFPATSDLSTFWSTVGVAASTSRVQNVKVAGGPLASPTQGYIDEASLDVEWAAALAPGATIRIYAANENDPVGDDELIQQLLADLPSQPSLHQLTISYRTDEGSSDVDYIAIEAQYMATLVSQGVTVFAASGDYGVLGNSLKSVQVGYPASMPDVTAVGGTSLTLDANGNVATEIAWGNLANSGRTGASGGGISTIFNRPGWQTGTGVPAGTKRLVPDVAAVADPATGVLIVSGGKTAQIGGTSLASPIWAAWCALLNQARATAGKAPLGALNPRLYPLAGTTAFRDITSGGNSVYSAGPGYDLCTGLGVPNVAALLQATMADTFAPVIEVQNAGRFTTIGQAATFYVVATGTPTPTYRWQRLATGTTQWTDLIQSANYVGVSSYALSVMGATAATNGDQFRCVIGNALGSVTSSPSALTVSAVGVSTLAGWPGWSGFADGQGSAGRFNYTGSVRVDTAGTVYVADASNHTVRKITPSGLVSTLAGAPGVSGSADGPGAVARFNAPAGVAVDASGNVFVADGLNYTIRKITPNGVVSTLAGTAGVRGRTDGTGSAASFYDPENLTIDAAGILYIADGAGNIVRKVTPAGVVTTIAGAAASGTTDGTGSAARFNSLFGIAVDLAGNLYVGDFNNNAVRKITPTGVVTTLAGLAGTRNAGFRDGTGTTARFNGPGGLAVDSAGSVYVADSFNNAIRKITADGVVTTVAGSATVVENIDGPLDVARFNGPADVAFDATGVLYVADAYNCTIRRIVLSVPTAPVIASAPVSQTVGLGGSLTLSVTATGTGPFTYQWFKDGGAISGATNFTYSVGAATAAAAGSYSVIVTGTAGSVSSVAAVVAVTTGASRLTNLSVQANAGGGQTLALGFVLSGTANKKILVRGIGPGLAAFGVPGTIADPLLTLFGPNSSTLVAATNDNWNSADATAIAATGAFPLAAGSKDAALFATLSTGNYTAQVAGPSTGAALAEIYDADLAGTAKLINLSTLASIGPGGTVTAGFTITGNVSKTVLIRGLGPALTMLGVTGTLPDPQLSLYNSSSRLLQGNDDWGATSALIAAFTQVGAFQFGSLPTKDAALLVTLPPGGYTAVLRGAAGTSGLALVEIYEVP